MLMTLHPSPHMRNPIVGNRFQKKCSQRASWLHCLSSLRLRLIELDGEDRRPAPLKQRKGKLEKLLARSDGIRFSEHLACDGATIFERACKLGLKGIVSKRRDLPYRSGRCRTWIKIKNPASPALLRIEDGTW